MCGAAGPLASRLPDYAPLKPRQCAILLPTGDSSFVAAESFPLYLNNLHISRAAKIGSRSALSLVKASYNQVVLKNVTFAGHVASEPALNVTGSSALLQGARQRTTLPPFVA
jgi:hypothetical protein